MRSVVVSLAWLKPEDGGRRRPVQGTSYSTVAHFPTIPPAELRHSAWSVVLDFPDPSAVNPSAAIMRFLAPDAPHEILTEGLTFELQEGVQVTAKGRVVEVV